MKLSIAKPLKYILIAALLSTSTNSPAYANYVSGPTGSQVNGYFIAKPEVKFTNLNCGNVTISPITLPVTEGIHQYSVYKHNGYFYTIDGVLKNLAACNGATFSTTNPVWSGTIKLDTVNPILSINSPVNNQNTSNSSISVNGTVSDATSGVLFVKVNGSTTPVNNTSFAMQVSLSPGLNSIEVIASDIAGHIASSGVITVFRSPSTDSSNTAEETAEKTPTGSKKDETTVYENQDSTTGSTEQPEEPESSTTPNLTRERQGEESVLSKIIRFASSPTSLTIATNASGFGGIGFSAKVTLWLLSYVSTLVQ